MGCDWCKVAFSDAPRFWPRLFRKVGYLLCYECWAAFYEKNWYEKMLRKGRWKA